PGYLARLWPWEYWVHVLVFVTFASTLWTILRAADLPLRDGGILLLGWGASPMLLSHSVEGYPWASAFLPPCACSLDHDQPRAPPATARHSPLSAARQRAVVARLRARQDGGGRVPGRYRPAPRRPALHARRLARRGPATDRRGSPRPPDREHQRVRLPAAESVAGAPTGRRHDDGRRRGPGQGHWHARTRPSDPLRSRRG